VTRLTAPQVAHALRAHPHGVTPSILSADLRATPSATRTHLTRLAEQGGCVREGATYRPLTDHEIRAQLLARLTRYPQLEYWPGGLARKLPHLHLTADEVHAHLRALAAAGHVTWTSDRGQPWQWYGVAL
jgi:predicted ArsR family transcriptional regulator